MILLSEMKIRKFFFPNWSCARQPLSSARSTLLYPFQMLNAKQGSSNSHLLTSFGMTRPGIEPTTSRLWGGRSTDWANTIRCGRPLCGRQLSVVPRTVKSESLVMACQQQVKLARAIQWNCQNIHETYNWVVKIDFNVTLRKIQCI